MAAITVPLAHEQLNPLNPAALQAPSTGLQQLGAGLMNAGGAALDIATQQQLRTNADAVFRATNDLQNGYNAFEQQARDRRGINAAGVTADATKFFDDATLKAQSQLANPAQVTAFQREAAQLRTSGLRTIAAHEADQQRVSLVDSASASIDANIQTATSNASDPVQVAQATAAVRDRLRTVAEANGYSPERAALEERAALDKLNSSVIQAQILNSNDMGQLRQLATVSLDHPLFQSLEPATVYKLQQAARSAYTGKRADEYLQIYGHLGTSAGATALAELDHDGTPESLASEIRASVNAGLLRRRDQQQQINQRSIEGIVSDVAAGTAGRETLNAVHTLYENGTLGPEQAASYAGQIERAVRERSSDEASAAAIAQAMAEGLPLDPRNADHRKALASAFASDSRGTRVGSAQWQSVAQAYATRTRMLPEQADAWMRQAMRSPDPQLAQSAAQFYGAVQATSPDATSSVDADTRAMAATVNGMVQAGTDPTRAVETARANVLEVNAETRKRRESEFTAVKDQDSALTHAIHGDFGHFFSADPVATSALRADWQTLSREYYQKTGDINAARGLAWSDLKRTYGVSKVNGAEQVMIAPPENFGVQPHDVRADIAEFLKANPQADGSTADEILVVPDGRTLRQSAANGSGLQPSYKLVTKSGDLVRDAAGSVKMYTLPNGDEMTARIKAAQAQAAQAAQAEIDAARKEREWLYQRQQQSLYRR